MRVTRLRLRLRWMMVAVAVVAVYLAASSRPHPVAGIAAGTFDIVGWSNGRCTYFTGSVPVDFVCVGPLIRVRWSDDTTGWYLSRKLRFVFHVPDLLQR